MDDWCGDCGNQGVELSPCRHCQDMYCEDCLTSRGYCEKCDQQRADLEVDDFSDDDEPDYTEPEDDGIEDLQLIEEEQTE